MTRRTNIVSQVGSYFASKGKVLTMEEYKNATDAPIRFVLIKRTIGSWGRLINMIGDISNYGTIEVAVSEEQKKPEAKAKKPKAEAVVEPVVETEAAPVIETEAEPVVEKTKGA